MQISYQPFKMSKFTIIIKRNGLYHFELTDDKETLLLASSGYVSKLNCESGIVSVKEHARRIDRFELKTSLLGGYYFNIIRPDGFIVVKSELFNTEEECKERIAQIRRNAPPAKIEDFAR